MDDELSQLKKEVDRLRADLDHLLRALGQEEILPEQPRSPYLLLEAELISIRHREDHIPIVLKAQQGHASISFNDNEGRARGLFQIDDDGSARFEIWNKEQQLVVSIGETKDGAGEIYVASRDGKPRAGMKVQEVGGIVSAQNSQGQPMALLVGKDEGGAVIVTGADGKPLAEIGVNGDCGVVTIKRVGGGKVAYITGDKVGGGLAICNDHGDPAATLTGSESGGALVFFDDIGTAISSLPGKLSSLRGFVASRKRGDAQPEKEEAE